MDHCLSKLLAENKRLTDNVCNIARQDYEKVRTVGTIMAVKITGYLELIGIGGSASGAGLFLSLLRVQLAPKLGGGRGHNLRYNAMEEEGRAAKYRWRILCTRCVQRCKERCSKSVRGTSIKTLFVADLIESVNLWRLIGTPDIWTGRSSIVVVGLIVEHRVYMGPWTILIYTPRILFHSVPLLFHFPPPYSRKRPSILEF